MKKETGALLSFMRCELFCGRAIYFLGQFCYCQRWSHCTLYHVHLDGEKFLFPEANTLHWKLPARAHSLGRFSPGGASDSVPKVPCPCMLEDRRLSLALLEAPLLPAQLFLPPGGRGHRWVLMRASLCFQGLGCTDRQLHPSTLRGLEGPKPGGSEWQQL